MATPREAEQAGADGPAADGPGASVRAPVERRDPAGERIARLADELLPALIARLGASCLGELEVRQGGWRIRLRRAAEASPSGGNEGHAERAGAPVGRRGPRHDAGGRSEQEGAPRAAGRRSDTPSATTGARPERPRSTVTSPAVGYYLPRDGLSPGQPVRAGDVLGHVDVLGVRHEVVAALDGVLGRWYVEPGEAVEYGQQLARLDLHARASESDTSPASEDASRNASVRPGAASVPVVPDVSPFDGTALGFDRAPSAVDFDPSVLDPEAVGHAAD